MIIECVLSDLPQHEMHFLSNGFLLHINGSEKDFSVFIQWIVMHVSWSFCLIFNGPDEGQIVDCDTAHFRNPQLSACSRMQIMQSSPMNI